MAGPHLGSGWVMASLNTRAALVSLSLSRMAPGGRWSASLPPSIEPRTALLSLSMVANLVALPLILMVRIFGIARPAVLAFIRAGSLIATAITSTSITLMALAQKSQ